MPRLVTGIRLQGLSDLLSIPIRVRNWGGTGDFPAMPVECRHFVLLAQMPAGPYLQPHSKGYPPPG